MLFRGGDISHQLPLIACSGCGRTLPSDQFDEDRHGPKRRSSRCRECCKETLIARETRNRVHREHAISDGHYKKCRKCGIQMLISDFPPDSRAQGGTAANCRKCKEVAHKKWRDRNIEHVRETSRTEARKRSYNQRNPEAHRLAVKKARIKRDYGITYDDLVRMVDEQGNKCAICGTQFSERGWGAAAKQIDHDHETGKVRGILCLKCNRGLGLFEENERRMVAAIAYLKFHGKTVIDAKE